MGKAILKCAPVPRQEHQPCPVADAHPSTIPSTPAAPARSARAAPPIPICWSPPFGRGSKTSGGKGAKGGNLESLGNGGLSDDGAKRRKPAETGGNSVQKLCSRNCPQFCCLTQGVQSKSLVGVSLAEIAEIGCRRLRRPGHCASMRAIFTYSAHLARCSRSCAAHCSRLSGLASSANSLISRLWISGEEMASLISAFSLSSIGRGVALGTAIARKPVLVKPGKLSLRVGSAG